MILRIAALCVMAALPAAAQSTAELTSNTTLRVCADPHDLPFSNDRDEGFENKIAQLIGAELHLPVANTYFPDSQGFIRATLLKDRCDVVIGTVVGAGDMSTTTPYYHTGYMIVTRSADAISASSVRDPRLAGKRFGLIAGTPPTDLLVAADLMDQTRIYPLMVDTRVEQPAHTMLQDLAAHRIDIGLVWAPIAGYYIAEEHLPLHAAFLDAGGSAARLDYRIAMGVRSSDTEFRRRLNRVIARRQADITAILKAFHIPLLEQ